MDPELLFSLSNGIALVAWLLLLFLPRWKVTDLAVRSAAVCLLFGAAYIILFVTRFSFTDSDFSTLSGLMAMFNNPDAVLIGWLHYLAFDLFVGIWIVQDAEKNNIRHWIIIPALLFTFMAGPSGLVIYFLIRTIRKKQLSPLSSG